jgi:hypothetical protein
VAVATSGISSTGLELDNTRFHSYYSFVSEVWQTDFNLYENADIVPGLVRFIRSLLAPGFAGDLLDPAAMADLAPHPLGPALCGGITCNPESPVISARAVAGRSLRNDSQLDIDAVSQLEVRWLQICCWQ